MNPDDESNGMNDGDTAPPDIPISAADALIAATAAPAPDDLAERIAATAAAARPVGRMIELGSGAAEPIDAFCATALELRALLHELNDAEWHAATATQYGTVRDLVAHLAGSEDYCTRAIERVPAADPTADFDHPGCSREVAASLAELTNSELADTWFALSTTFAEACRTDPDTVPVSLHQLPVSIGGALVLRTFELWAHTEDICVAIGRPLPRLDGPRLSCMASRLVDAIGSLVRLPDAPDVTGRVVLLGPGGGVAEFGAPATGDAPGTRIVADIVDYCRVASRRLSAADLPRSVTGDDRLVAPFLAATAMFAKD
jgi:uncharacterized protein (TIGR03083 family)